MATSIKRIEKDFLLKVLLNEQIPIIYTRDKTNYTLTVEKLAKEKIFLKSDRPIGGLRIHKKLDLKFNYHGQIILFTADVSDYKDNLIITPEPEFLFKNLERSFSRVPTPTDLDVQVIFSGEHYHLSYPKVRDSATVSQEQIAKTLASENLSELVDQMEAWIKNYASGHKLVIFKDVKPSTTEEKVVVELGKALFLPSTSETLPNHDPFLKKKIITEDLFKQHLVNTGVALKHLNEVLAHFIERKKLAGISSELWAPILFQEYVVGYLHMWVKKEKKPPFDFDVLENVLQFSEILSYSLKVNGYFDTGKVENESFEGSIIDISVSGILFAYPNSPFAMALMPGNELSVQIKAKNRTVMTKAKIVRRHKDETQRYFGCRFVDIQPEDIRFLFEYIYGKTFTDEDAIYLTGHV